MTTIPLPIPAARVTIEADGFAWTFTAPYGVGVESMYGLDGADYRLDFYASDSEIVETQHPMPADLAEADCE